MFKYYPHSDDINNVFTYIKSYDSIPKVIISDMDFLINSKSNSIINSVINEPLTIDFFIIDTDKVTTVQDNLNSIIDALYSQDVINSSFFMHNTIPIQKINNIIKVSHPDDKNTLLYDLIHDKFYRDSFESPIKFFLLFSSLPDLIDFICKYDNFKHVCFLLKPNVEYNYTKIEEIKAFIEKLIH